MNKKRLFTCMMAVASILGTQQISAQGQPACYASEVINYTPGTLKNSANPVAANRQDATKALGMPEEDNTENFVSLGYGGSITLAFGGLVEDLPGIDIRVVETSYASNDCMSDGIESASIYLSQNGVDFIFAGQLCRDGGVDIAATGLAYVSQIKIVNDDISTTFDGYDVDGVIAVGGCNFIPDTGCYAVELMDFAQGTLANGNPITDPNRIDPNKALGEPENSRANGAQNFVSLGNGGYIVLRMGGDIVTDGGALPDLRVYETTWGNPSCANYPEYAEILVSHNMLSWYSLGVHCQSSNISLDIDAAIPAGLKVQYVKIQTSLMGTTEDYFDVDGVEALFGCSTPDTEQPGGCYAMCAADENGYVQGTKKNGGALPDTRTHWDRALGTPQFSDATTSPANNNFVSLGYGGSLTLCFDGIIYNQDGPDVEIIETSFGNPSCASYPEYADVYGSLDGVTFYYITTGCHNFTVDFSDSEMYLPYVKYLRIVNNDTLTTTPDGYDVDGVRVISAQCNETFDTPAPVNPAPRMGLTTYPNPSNGVVNFNISLVDGGNVAIEIFNMNGQRVGVAFNGEAQQGQTTATFNMSHLPNGVYISKMTTSEGVVTEKIMLAR